MENQELEEIGKIAFREEGELWVSYYQLAPDDKIPLMKINMNIVNRLGFREEFVELSRAIAQKLIYESLGISVTFGGEQPAPENERTEDQ